MGVEIFEIDDLEALFESKIFKGNHKQKENFRLIAFLYERAENYPKGEEKNIWNHKLRTTRFIFDEKEKLKSPQHIYFPTIQFSEDFGEDISIVHSNTMKEIESNKRIKNWLSFLGIKEPSDVSFIEKTIIGNDKYITVENAISVCRFLFDTYKKGLLTDEHLDSLKIIKILTILFHQDFFIYLRSLENFISLFVKSP